VVHDAVTVDGYGSLDSSGTKDNGIVDSSSSNTGRNDIGTV